MESILSKYFRGTVGKIFAATILLSSVYTTRAENHPPAVAISNDIYVSKNAPYAMSFSELVALTGASDADGDSITFVVSALQNGSLSVNGSPVTIATTVIGSGDTLTWTPPANVYNTFVPAFQIEAFDSQDYSATATQIGASIRGNNPPGLTFVEALSRQNLANAHKNERLTLTFNTLKDLSDLRDMDDDGVSFTIDSVLAGTVWIDGQLVNGRTVFGSANVLTWMPPTNFVGTVAAFKVLGFDGTDVSATPLSVSIEVTDPTPKFTKGANQKVLRDDFGQWIDNWATGIGPNEYALHFETANDNPSLFLSEPQINDDGTLGYIVAPSAFGVANVSVVLADDQGHRSASQSFTITVSFVNYAPEFDLPEELNVSEDAGLQKVVGFASNINAGEGESFQTVAFAVTTANPSLYSIKPTISTDGTLTFKTATNAFGDDVVTVTLKDNGNTANGGINLTTKTFALHVTSVNDAPALALKSISLNEDTDAFVNLLLTDPDNVTSNLTVQIPTLPTDFITSATAAFENGAWRLHLVPRADAFGKTILNVLVSDGQASRSYPVAVTINPVNDAPHFALSRPSVTVMLMGQMISVPGFAIGISTGAANETNQTVSFVVTAADPTFFASKPSISSDGTLKFKVVDNTVGTNLVTVVAKDSGGVAYGGVNLSAAQSFYIVAPKNPFPELKGSYTGLFFEDSEVKHGSSGSVLATVTDKGVCSGKLLIEGGSYGFSGQFSILGQATVNLPRAGKTPLKLDLTISADGLTGTVTEAQWVATLFADKAIYSTAKPAPQAGKYTMNLKNGDSAVGVATLTVSPAGAVAGTITLPNNTVVSVASFVTKSGQFPVYSALYTGSGSALGWMTFSNATTTDLTGNLSYIRVSSIPEVGFTNTLAAAGSAFVTPAIGHAAIAMSSASVTLSGSGVASDLHVTTTLNTNNLFTCSGYGMSLKLNLQSGLVTGSFIHPGTKLATPIKAVVLQKANGLSGFFVGRDGTGNIDLN